MLKEKNSHPGFVITNAGLHISVDHPFLAASPDGLLHCACHGEVLIEVKCPFKHRLSTVRMAIEKDKDFCLAINESGELELKRTHPYYFQVQLQMLVCRAKLVFSSFTTVELVYIFISYDRPFAESLIPRSKLFFLNVVIPEMIGKYFTSTRYLATSMSSDAQFIPKAQYNPKIRSVIKRTVTTMFAFAICINPMP